MKKSETPYIAHLFVCVNDRLGERKSCADGNSPLIKAELKRMITKNQWKGKVRVSTSGCLGICQSGPNVMIHPQKILFSSVTMEDLDEIEAELTEIIQGCEDNR